MKRRHCVCIALMLLGTLSTAYFLWAHHRWPGAIDFGTPRPWPYPDARLVALEHWYDHQWPAPPGTIKLHGEIFTVRLTLLLAIAGSIAMVSTGVLPLVLRHITRQQRRRDNCCPQCGYDLRATAGPTCPECGGQRK